MNDWEIVSQRVGYACLKLLLLLAWFGFASWSGMIWHHTGHFYSGWFQFILAVFCWWLAFDYIKRWRPR